MSWSLIKHCISFAAAKVAQLYELVLEQFL